MILRIYSYFITHKARIRRLSKEAGWVATGQIASVLGALVLVRVLTEYLEPTEYGQLALGLTIAGLVNQVVMGGVGNGINRFYSIAAEKGDLFGYLRAARQLLLIATAAVIGFAVILMGGLAAAGLHHWLWLALTALLFSIFSGYNSALNGIQNAARQRAIVALHGGMDAWLKIGLAVGVILWLGANSAAVVLGYALSALFVTVSQFFFLRRLIARQGVSCDRAAHEDWQRQIWTFAWPFSAWGIFTWGQQISDRWALEGFATTSEVGQYAVVFQLGYTPIGLLTGLMITLIGPILYQRAGAAQDASRNASVHRIVWRITQAGIALASVGFAVTWFTHDWLFRWLVADAFRETSYLLPWVVLAGGLFAAGQMLSLKMVSELRAKALFPLKAATSLLGIGANILGAWLFGMEGVVGALVFFSAVYLGWMVILAFYLLTTVDTQKPIVHSQNYETLT